MTTSEKLKLIQKYSGLTQEQLAAKIGVTFAALNRWINTQAKPRSAMQGKIDELYREYSGEKVIPEQVLQAKKHLLYSKSRPYKNILKLIDDRPDIRDQFDLSLTYHSNRIEGSTLTENETGAILFHNKALPNKSLSEQLEAKNHQTALHFLYDFLTQKSHRLDENFILKIHAILMNGIHADAGRYRYHGVRIVGTHVVTANFMKVPMLMGQLTAELNTKIDDPLKQVALTHARFEQIHPFGDGNGRVGRLLMHAMLLRYQLPPALIRQEDRQKYFTYLQKAQIQGDASLLEDFLCDAVLGGFDILGEP